jgi:hypothetical protein
MNLPGDSKHETYQPPSSSLAGCSRGPFYYPGLDNLVFFTRHGFTIFGVMGQNSAVFGLSRINRAGWVSLHLLEHA